LYNGNPDLRKAGEYIDYTPEMLEEIIKCSVDPIYFAEKYFTIIHPDRGKEVIQLFDYQKKMLKVYVDPPDERTFSIICIARQMGKTTLTTIYLLWYALFNRDKTVCVIANKEATAIEILDRIKLAYKGLPLWMQQGIKEGGWNAKRVELDNGTRIIAASTSADSISGLSVSLLFIDEFAKIPKAVAEDFITSTYPVISAGKKSKIIIVSTPLGKNLFWEFWSKAIKGKNNFYPIKVKWWEHPERDQQWKKKIIADIGKLRFAQEYECKFLGSNNTLIDSDILEKTDFEEPIDFKWTGLLSIYEKPLQNSMYVLGVDTSKGTGRDYSVVQVLKINHDQSLEQVAVYRNNIIRPRDFAQICISISSYYNNAMMMIENNDVGSIVCEVIWYDYECDRIVNLDPKGLGIRSTKTTKPLANLMLKEYVEEGYLKIVDKSTISELELYEEVSPDVFACDNGNDDCVTSLLWALYFVKTEFYDGPIVSVTGEIEDRYRIKEEECDMPVMILD